MLNQKGSSLLLILLTLTVIFLLISGAYYLGKLQSNSKTISETSTNLLEPTPKPAGVFPSHFKIEEIVYLSKYSSNNSEFDRNVFITTSDESQYLKIADLKLTPNSVKILHTITLPSAIGFNPPVYSAGNYLVVKVSGGDSGDIMIFNSDGQPVTTSVYKTNPELNDWILSYSGQYLGKDVISINLFKIDNSTGLANIDLKTGQLIPNSLIIK